MRGEYSADALAALDEAGEGPPIGEIEPWAMPVWHAWRRLSEDRPYLSAGMGGAIPSRIAYRDVVQWCENHLGADIEFFDSCIYALDTAFLAHMADKRAAAAAALPPPRKG